MWSELRSVIALLAGDCPIFHRDAARRTDKHVHGGLRLCGLTDGWAKPCSIARRAGMRQI